MKLHRSMDFQILEIIHISVTSPTRLADHDLPSVTRPTRKILTERIWFLFELRSAIKSLNPDFIVLSHNISNRGRKKLRRWRNGKRSVIMFRSGYQTMEKNAWYFFHELDDGQLSWCCSHKYFFFSEMDLKWRKIKDIPIGFSTFRFFFVFRIYIHIRRGKYIGLKFVLVKK
jgi:SpoU rRNA methylase family enzyme